MSNISFKLYCVRTFVLWINSFWAISIIDKNYCMIWLIWIIVLENAFYDFNREDTQIVHLTVSVISERSEYACPIDVLNDTHSILAVRVIVCNTHIWRKKLNNSSIVPNTDYWLFGSSLIQHELLQYFFLLEVRTNRNIQPIDQKLTWLFILNYWTYFSSFE